MIGDYSARISAASGDAGALLTLAIELAQEVSRLAATAAALEQADVARRSKQAERTRRHRNVTQRDITPQGVTERDVTAPPPPQVSSSFPTPHITPSFPPTPLPPQAPQGNAEEVRLHQRAPEAWPAVVQFLAGKDAVARAAWMGRFHGAMDRPPHPTGQELADALGDLMTEPRDKWVPTLFRRYVERIRRDAERAIERADAPRAAGTPTSDAGRVFAAIRALVTETPNPGRGIIRSISKAAVAELGDAALAAYEQCGGAQRFLDQDEKVGFLLRDFTNAYRPARAGAA